jgi:hypothetical protein
MSNEQYAEFQRLVDTMETLTQHMSSLGRTTHFPAFKNLIAMGDTARTFIFREMRRGVYKWLWFELLHKLTPDMNPVARAERGKLKEMSEAWIKLADIKKW